MRMQIRKKKLLLKSLLIGAGSLLITIGPAVAQESILHQAIHDYSDDTSSSFGESGSDYLTGRYVTETILDEAYHDYDGIETDASSALAMKATEDAEFAAVEQSTTFDDIVPWELRQ